MKETLEKAKEYVLDHKKEFRIGVIVVVAIAVIILGLALYSYNTRQPKIVYEPANACDLLTMDEAKSLLGDSTINGIKQTPIQRGDTTTSQCGYSDGLVDTSHAVVAAVNIRSAINEGGVKLNKAQFEAGKPTGAQDITGIGDEAYFNSGLGQLNILKDTTWIIVSYGSGANPQGNTLADDEKLAKLVLNAQ
jgi:hypothetical protein